MRDVLKWHKLCGKAERHGQTIENIKERTWRMD